MKNHLNDFIDRELSWLDFNTRVLELAENNQLPLLERVKFLAIFSSNLDEFFMVRVASLKRKIEFGNHEPLTSGLTPKELIGEIHHRVRGLQERFEYLLESDLHPRLAEQGIKRVKWDSLSDEERIPLTQKFINNIFPVLTPLASDPTHPFPHISGLSLNLGIIGRNTETGEDQFVRVKVPSNISRIMRTNDVDHSYILLEDLIAEHLHLLLPGADINEIYFFRVTRNQDLDIDEDDAEDLLETMEEELSRRKFGAAVRMEIERGVGKRHIQKLAEELELTENEIFAQNPPLDNTYLFEMYGFDFPQLKDQPFLSVKPHELLDIDRQDADAFFSAIREREILLHHPYQTFTSTVTRFVELAARDPKVLVIKQTLYRTSGDSPIMMSLIEAAKAGKQVLAVIELRARFDEQANVRWAKKLEDAGAHVVYGVLGLKTHAKSSLVVRKEDENLTVYTHIGTGNYNPKTAKIYDDLGLLSSDPVLGQDVLKMFNQLSGIATQNAFSRLWVAPHGIRTNLVEAIRRERENFLAGKPAMIRWKLNSLVDNKIIEELYAAAKDGVPIELTVRGTCSLRMSKVAKHGSVKIRSILGRFLEHSRIYYFHNNGEPLYYIGSADIMERNLDRRVEALVRIDSEAHKSELNELLTLAHDPRFRAWSMNDRDQWEYGKNDGDGKALEDYQEHLLARFIK